jgi:hypothetical protein
MAYEIEISGARRAIRIKIDGLLFLDEQYALSNKLIEILRSRKLTNILIDARGARSTRTAHVDINALRSFLAGNPRFVGMRTAILCSDFSHEANMIAGILRDNGLKAEVFTSLGEADRWLLGKCRQVQDHRGRAA